MTVASNVRKLSYTGNGVTTNFSVTFQFYEIAVYVDGTLKSEGAGNDYTITGGSGSTGTVVFNAAPANGTAVAIVGATSIVQETDYTENGDFPAETHEMALDRVTMAVREMSDKLGQTIRAPFFDAAISEMDFAGTAAESYLRVSSSGVPSIEPIVGGQLETVLDAAVASAIADAETAQAAAEAAQSAAEGAQTAAETAQTGAELAETNAAASAAAAATSYDNFDDRYLGAKAADPTLDNDGNALITGALYFNTASNVMKAWTGSTWVVSFASGLDAGSITFTPAGSVAATDVQAAIVELDGDITGLGGSDIAFTPAGSIAATNVQAAIEELDGDITGLTAADIASTATGDVAATNVQAAIAELASEKLAASSYTASDVRTKLLTVDGAGSGIDADLLDGISSASFVQTVNSIGPSGGNVSLGTIVQGVRLGTKVDTGVSVASNLSDSSGHVVSGSYDNVGTNSWNTRPIQIQVLGGWSTISSV